MWKLSKLKNGILEISPIKVEFEDTYSTIHLRDYYIEKFKLSPPCQVDKVLLPKTYNSLSALVTEVNLFKPREEVPNKRVMTDREGTSKLIRSKDKTRIEIAYRVRNKSGQVEKYATSNNTCYISNEQRERFFKHSKGVGCPVSDKWGHSHYILELGDANFDYWSDIMDEEYWRLAGGKPKKRLAPLEPNRDEYWNELFNQCLLVYAETQRGSDMAILEALANEGYCKLNDKKTSLYDVFDYWICQPEEFLEKDGEAFMLKGILNWLDEYELLGAKAVLEKFI